MTSCSTPPPVNIPLVFTWCQKYHVQDSLLQIEEGICCAEKEAGMWMVKRGIQSGGRGKAWMGRKCWGRGEVVNLQLTCFKLFSQISYSSDPLLQTCARACAHTHTQTHKHTIHAQIAHSHTWTHSHTKTHMNVYTYI